jgi:hypothetical protein
MSNRYVLDLDKVTKTSDYTLNSAELLRPQVEIARAAQETANRSLKSFLGALITQQQTLDRIGEGIKKMGESFSKLVGDGIKKMMESLQAMFDPVRNIFDTLSDFLRRLWKSNFLLIVRASEDDKIALDQLGKLWWYLMLRYMELEKAKNKRPTKAEFHNMVREICWRVLDKEEESTSWFGIAKKVYFSISARILVDYAEIYTTRNKTQSLNVDIVDQEFKSSLSLYNHEGQPHLFVKTVAEESGVSPQTIRSWIKKGDIKAINHSYFSRVRRAIVPSYLIPYRDSILWELEDIKKEQENKKLHRIEGYFTISQIIKVVPISRKTLERWDKAGKLVPRRIKGNRYYSLDKVKAILAQSQSPRVRAFVLQRNLATALTS